jgi:hypothetical protein
MLPESWLEPEAVKDDADLPPHTFVGHTILPCPTLLIVIYDVRLGTATTDAALEDLMSLGCVMQNMWLVTESLGALRSIAFGECSVSQALATLTCCIVHIPPPKIISALS